MKNICKFIPVRSSSYELHTLSFVYERHPGHDERLTSNYALYLVTRGSGWLHTADNHFAIKCGDIFITFPAQVYSISKTEGLECMYIRFIGLRSQVLADRIGITYTNPVRRYCRYLIGFWKENLESSNENNIDLISESVLLYTFAQISTSIEKDTKKLPDLALQIKQHIDENFNQTDLTLSDICKKFNYNTKYISALFKRHFEIGFSEYLQTIRIQYACTLIGQGVTTVKDLADMCGFKDPLYFSKIFKKHLKASPKDHILEMRSQNSFNS